MKKIVVTVALVTTMCLAVGCKKAEETKTSTEHLTNELQKTEGTPLPGPEDVDSIKEKEEETNGNRVSFMEETEEEKDGEFVYFKSSLYYPVFEGENAYHLNRFVEETMETFRESLDESKENARYDYEDSLLAEYSVSIFPEKEEFAVSCLWDTDSYVTLFTKCISSTGGVHPNVFCQAYVVDVTTGSQESMENMLATYGITLERVVEYTAERIREEHGEDLYVYDEISDLEKDIYRFTQRNQWYFSEKGLVLFANPTEIAAYAYGMIECEITYEELEQGLKK